MKKTHYRKLRDKVVENYRSLLGIAFGPLACSCSMIHADLGPQNLCCVVGTASLLTTLPLTAITIPVALLGTCLNSFLAMIGLPVAGLCDRHDKKQRELLDKIE